MDGIGEASTKAPTPAWATRRRFDVADYHRMTVAGILHEDDAIELIEGEIIEMAAIGGPHIGAVIALRRLLFLASADRFVLSVQNPLRLDDRSEPGPDLTLLRPRADGYRGEQPPLAEDVLLVIEVAGRNLNYDRQVKLPLYARHGIPELWIVDLAGGAIEVCRAPEGDGYGDVRLAGRSDHVAPLALPGARIAVSDALPG